MTINVGTLAVQMKLAKASFDRDVKTSATAMENLSGVVRDTNGRLRDAKGRFVGAGGAAREFAAGAKQAGGAAAGAAKNTGDLDSEVKQLVATYLTLETARRAFRMAETAAQVEDARRVFENMGGSIEGVRRATRGLISDAELFKQANFAKTLGFTGQQFEQLAQVALASSKVMGMSVEESFRRVVQGTAKMEIEILEEAGILAKVGPAVERYAAAHGKAAKELTEAERRQAFFNEVVLKGNAVVEQAAKLGDTAADSFARMRAQISNTADVIGTELIPAMQGVARAVDDVNDLAQAYRNLDESTKEVIRGAGRGLAHVLTLGLVDSNAEAFAQDVEEQREKIRKQVQEHIAFLVEAKKNFNMETFHGFTVVDFASQEAEAQAKANAEKERAAKLAEQHAKALAREAESLRDLVQGLSDQTALARARRESPAALVAEQFAQQTRDVEARFLEHLEKGGGLNDSAERYGRAMTELRAQMQDELLVALHKMASEGELTTAAFMKARTALEAIGGVPSAQMNALGVIAAWSKSVGGVAAHQGPGDDFIRNIINAWKPSVGLVAAHEPGGDTDAAAKTFAQQVDAALASVLTGGGASGVATIFGGAIGSAAVGAIQQALTVTAEKVASLFSRVMSPARMLAGEKFGRLGSSFDSAMRDTSLVGAVPFAGPAVQVPLAATIAGFEEIVAQTNTFQRAQSRVNELFDKLVSAAEPFAEWLLYSSGVGDAVFIGLKMMATGLIKTVLVIDYFVDKMVDATNFLREMQGQSPLEMDFLSDKQAARMRASLGDLAGMEFELSDTEKRARSAEARERFKQRKATEDLTEATREHTRELKNMPDVFKLDRAVANADQGERRGGRFSNLPTLQGYPTLPISVGNRWSNFEPAN